MSPEPEPDVEGWIAIAVALVVGGVAGWLIAFHQWNENVTRAAAYTIGIFLLLAMTLRPAWHRVSILGGSEHCVGSAQRRGSVPCGIPRCSLN
jgi:uncharacterized membrane protein